jgi:hypothetical protein
MQVTERVGNFLFLQKIWRFLCPVSLGVGLVLGFGALGFYSICFWVLIFKCVKKSVFGLTLEIL